MRHHDHRDAPLPVQLLEDRHDLDAGARIQGSRRFVGQDQLRIVDQAARDGDALLLSAGELAGVMIGALRQTHDRQGLHRAFFRVAGVSSL